MINPTPQKEHKWLERFVGEWTTDTEAIGMNDQPPKRYKGTEVVRSLDGIWFTGDGSGEMGPMIITLGFDPDKKKFVGTVVTSMLTYLWIYEGELDADEKVLTLDTVGPSFSDEGSTVPYKDSFEFISDDHRVLISKMQGTDGQWTEMMRTDYRRVK